MRTSDFRTTTSGTSRLRAAAGATAVAAVSVAGLVLGSGSAAAAGTVTVLPSDIAPACGAVSATGFCTFTRGNGAASIVADTTALPGAGAAQLSTPGSLATDPGGNDKTTIFSQQFAGKKLSEITTLQYQTYIDTLGETPFQAPALNIEVNPKKAGVPTSTTNPADDTFTTLVFEPYYTADPAGSNPIKAGTVQTWDPSSTPTGRGGWWASDSVSSPGQPNKYGFDTYTASFADVQAALPDAVVGQIGLNQGGGNPALTSLADGLTVNDTTYDFELTPPAPPAATGPADLTVKVTAGPAASGSPTDVQVVVTNNGANPSGPTTATALAPGYAIADPGTGTLNDNGSVTYGVPYLAPGASATFSLTTEAVTGFRFGLAGAIVLPAPGQPDPNIFNNLSVVPLITR